jgi:serine/threonine protein kinase
VLPESIIAGRYRIETLIGVGGMGAVYRVSDTFEMEQVALKILTLTASVVDIQVASERFRREARYAHQLKHKNIVPVLNFGQDKDLLFISMPIITGGTLKSLLKAEHPLAIQQTQRYLNELAEAVDAIHNHPQQIVHRDIKPSNLLIHQDDGRLMVADFGIARAMQEEAPLTQRGWHLGTEHYIAPEQLHGNPEPASDMYAMGVIAYQMLTGLLPFQAVVKNQAAELPAPSDLNLALPPAINDVILRAMEIDPQLRYSSGQDFAQALNNALTQDTFYSEPTILDTSKPMLIAQSSANIMTRTMTPENPCWHCGQENRSTSRFCRRCGNSLGETIPIITTTYQVGYGSDIGQQAQDNEDMLLVIQGLCQTLIPPHPFTLLAIADGLRGPQGATTGGHEASRLAIETVADIVLPLLAGSASSHTPHSPTLRNTNTQQTYTTPTRTVPTEAMLTQWVNDAVRQANQVIYHCNADYDTEMKSTLTVALIYKHSIAIANIGDSRAYHYSQRQQTLRQLTRDHTFAANLVEAKLMHANEVYNSPKRHQHYRYLGQNYQIPIDQQQEHLEVNDLILLCTDGLWHMLRDEKIQEIISNENDPQQIAQELIDAANAAGETGNISAIVVRIQ